MMIIFITHWNSVSNYEIWTEQSLNSLQILVVCRPAVFITGIPLLLASMDVQLCWTLQPSLLHEFCYLHVAGNRLCGTLCVA